VSALAGLSFKEHMELAVDALNEVLDEDILVTVQTAPQGEHEDAVTQLLEDLETAIRVRIERKLEEERMGA
jgi:hypothetical protein